MERRKYRGGSLDFDPIDPNEPGDVIGVYEANNGNLDTEASIKAEMTEGGPLMPQDDDERDAYANEEISYLRNRGRLYSSDGVRLNPPPRWYFKHDIKGQIQYRRAHPEHEIGGFPTENWLFTHRNGEQACGDDPLEYFSDWEGSEAGDVQEPTPFGTQLTKAKRKWPPGTGVDDEQERGGRLIRLGLGFVRNLVYNEDDYPLDPSMHVAPGEESEEYEEVEDEDSEDEDEYEDGESDEDEEEAEEEHEDSEDEEYDHHMEGQ